MPLMWDFKANNDVGAWINVPDSNVMSLYSTGNYAFKAGAQIPVQLRTGEFTNVDESEFYNVIQNKGRYDTLQDRRGRRSKQIETVLAEEYGGDLLDSLTGILIGAGETLVTEAVTKKIATGVFGVNQAAFEAYQKYNPTERTIGKVAGFVAPALATLGTSLLPSVARGVLPTLGKALLRANIPTLATWAGRTAVQKVGLKGAAAVGGRLAKTGSVLGAAAITGAVDGAVLATAEELSKLTFEDTGKTLNEIASDIGTFSLMSGGLTTLFSGIGGGIALGSGKILSKMTKGTIFDMSEEAAKRAGLKFDKVNNTKLAEKYVTDGSEAIIEAATQVENRKSGLIKMFTGDRDKPGMIQRLVTTLEEVGNSWVAGANKIADKYVNSKVFGKNIGSVFEEVSFEISKLTSRIAEAGIDPSIKSGLIKVREVLLVALERAGTAKRFKAGLLTKKSLQKIFAQSGVKWPKEFSKKTASEILSSKQYRRVLLQNSGKGVADSEIQWGRNNLKAVSEGQVIIDEAHLGRFGEHQLMIENIGNSFGKIASDKERQAIASSLYKEILGAKRLANKVSYDKAGNYVGDELHGTLKRILDDSSLWGDEVVGKLKPTNEQFSTLLGLQRELIRKVGLSGKKQTALGGFYPDDSKISEMVNRLLKGKEDTAARLLNDFSGRLQAYSHAVAGTLDEVGIKSISNVNKINALLKEQNKKILELRDDTAMYKLFKTTFGKSALPYVGGWAWLGGAKTVLALSALKGLNDPVFKLQSRMKIMQIAASGAKKIDKSIKRTSDALIKGDTLKGKGKIGVSDWFKELRRFGGIEVYKSSTKKSDSENKAIQSFHIISELANNPTYLTKIATDATSSLNDMPELQAEAQQKIVDTINFIWENTPEYGVSRSLDPFSGKPEYSVSASGAHKFLKIILAAANPIENLGYKIERGTLNKNDVNAAKQLAPKLYIYWLAGVMENILGSEKPLNYTSKLMLTILTGMPANATLTSGGVAALQLQYDPELEEMQRTTGKSSTKLSDKISDSHRTELQRIAIG